MIEAELKVRVHDAESLNARLRRLGEPELSTYEDTYYDRPDGSLDADDRELRIRTITTGQTSKTVLTYKEPALADSGSKPEYELEISDAAALAHIVSALGYPPSTRLTKHCTNFRFGHEGRQVLATIVQVPEVDGTFMEVEMMVEEKDLAAALGSLHSLLADLRECDLTDEKYTDAVATARGTRVTPALTPLL